MKDVLILENESAVTSKTSNENTDTTGEQKEYQPLSPYGFFEWFMEDNDNDVSDQIIKRDRKQSFIASLLVGSSTIGLFALILWYIL